MGAGGRQGECDADDSRQQTSSEDQPHRFFLGYLGVGVGSSVNHRLV